MLGTAAIAQLAFSELPQAAPLPSIGWPEEWGKLRHDPAELEERIKRQRNSRFSRKKFKELEELEAAAKEAERKAGALKEEQERSAALAAAEEAKQAVLEARKQQAGQWSDLHGALQLKHSFDSFNAAQVLADHIRRATLMSHVAKTARPQKEDDDEEALALLLLH